MIPMEVVPLHKHPEFMKQCIILINSEWQRSEMARLQSLRSSSDKLPTCLILVKDKVVLGHCKLSRIPSMPEACFVESVVISKKERGKGLGTLLMEKAEKHCKEELKLKCIYLSTKGQELFYKKLGYQECEPISIYGGGSGFINCIKSFTSSNNNQSSSGTVNVRNSKSSGKTYMNKFL